MSRGVWFDLSVYLNEILDIKLYNCIKFVLLVRMIPSQCCKRVGIGGTGMAFSSSLILWHLFKEGDSK